MKVFFIKRMLLVLVLALPAFSGAWAQNKMFLIQDQCVRCHLLAENRGQEHPVVAWKQSVHFRPDTSCADCHGGDRLYTMEFKKGHMGIPGDSETYAMCVKCHQTEKTDFENRFIGLATHYKCTVSCVHCHDHHQVEKAHSDLVNTTNCGKCHDFSKAANIRARMEEADDLLAAVRQNIAYKKEKGFPVESDQKHLAAIEKAYARTFHAVPMGGVEARLQKEIIGPLTEIKKRTSRYQVSAWRAQGVVVVLFLLVVALLAGLYLKNLRTRNKS